VGKSLFRYAPEALPHEILNNCIAIHWPTFAPPRWPTFTPALTQLHRHPLAYFCSATLAYFYSGLDRR
jgi:hypothetical protein